MGFSAGGSLSARASTLFSKRTYLPVDKADSLSCRPSFTKLIYPAYLDQGTNLTLTPELKMSKDVPPMYIFQTADDQYGNSALVMAGALRDNKTPVELHLLPTGGHGYGLRQGKQAAETWPLLAEKWLTNILNTKK
jgi:acetyl esterase/lipase